MVRRSIAIAAVGLVLAAACIATGDPSGTPVASPSPGTQPPDSAAGRTLTPADDGAILAMTVGETAELVVADPAAPDPTVEGDAVALVAVINVAPSGRREWEVRAERPGRAVIHGRAQGPYEITIVVDP